MTDNSKGGCSTTVVLVRHGDVHNPQDIVYGRLPRFRLSDIGREEAARSAETLRELDITAIYSSPMLRARQTAAIVAAAHPGLKVRITPLLNEVKTAWQGTANAEMAKNKYSYYDQPKDPGDETIAQVAARMIGWFAMVLKRHPCGIVVGVSHGDPSMVPRLIYSGIEPSVEALRNEALYPQKASIIRFVFNESGDPWKLQPEVFYDDPNRSAREEREAVRRAERGETAAAEPSSSPVAPTPDA